LGVWRSSPVIFEDQANKLKRVVETLWTFRSIFKHAGGHYLYRHNRAYGNRPDARTLELKMKYSLMKSRKPILLLAVALIPLTGLVLAAKSPKDTHSAQVTRGGYLVVYGGCNDCHTPLKFTDQGPVPDMSRMLSGHPETVKLPDPDLKAGPWFAATAGMTAWAGPWGTSFAANLTPDRNTGLGIWTKETFFAAMKKGKHMGSGRGILPPMPWQNLSQLTDEDLEAIYVYLRTIPPIENHVPEPVLSTGPASFE
jgi:mono/diheme cytochrome c family protein